MKYRIVRHLGDGYMIQKRVFFRWVNMSSSIFTEVEDAKRFLTHLVKQKYKKDVVFESDTKTELKKINSDLTTDKPSKTKEQKVAEKEKADKEKAKEKPKNEPAFTPKSRGKGGSKQTGKDGSKYIPAPGTQKPTGRSRRKSH